MNDYNRISGNWSEVSFRSGSIKNVIENFEHNEDFSKVIVNKQVHNLGLKQAKGLALAGAFAIITPAMKELLIAYAKPLDYTHPLKPFDLGILNAALNFQIQVGNTRRKHIYSLTKLLVNGLREQGFYVMTKTYFPIISVWSGNTEKLLKAIRILYDGGIFLTSCPYPTMPKGFEALRITVTSEHTKEHIIALLSAFEKVRDLWINSNVSFFPKN